MRIVDIAFLFAFLILTGLLIFSVATNNSNDKLEYDKVQIRTLDVSNNTTYGLANINTKTCDVETIYEYPDNLQYTTSLIGVIEGLPNWIFTINTNKRNNYIIYIGYINHNNEVKMSVCFESDKNGIDSVYNVFIKSGLSEVKLDTALLILTGE